MLAIAFAAVMPVAGQLYIESRSERLAANPIRAIGVSAVGQAAVNLLPQ
jgi:hypothetical protein